MRIIRMSMYWQKRESSDSALLVYFLVCIYRKIIDSSSDPAIQTGLLLGFWTLVFASFTEHRIVTPSNILPFSLMLGLMVANANAVALSQRKQPAADGKLSGKTEYNY